MKKNTTLSIAKKEEMGVPHSLALRREVIQRYESGQRRIDISQDLDLSYRTICQWIKCYKTQGEASFKYHYDKCGSKSRVSQQVKQESIALKKDHPSWGAAYIRIQLAKKYPNSYLPGARQLQRYFCSAGVNQIQQIRPRAKGAGDWANHPFYRVQADAKEQLKTADGKPCSYLTYTDEHSGGVLDAFVFPL